MQKFIFLDRDDTLNHDTGYLSDPEKVKIKKNVIEGLIRLKNAGYNFIVITNQSGVGRGYFNVEKVYAVNKRIKKILKKENIKIEKFYFCPHAPIDNCNCRKPKIGLFKQVKKDYKVDVKKSYMIGDKCSDINFGENAGLQTILLKSNKYSNINCDPDFVCDDLIQASSWILKNEKI